MSCTLHGTEVVEPATILVEEGHTRINSAGVTICLSKLGGAEDPIPRTAV